LNLIKHEKKTLKARLKLVKSGIEPDDMVGTEGFEPCFSRVRNQEFDLTTSEFQSYE